MADGYSHHVARKTERHTEDSHMNTTANRLRRLSKALSLFLGVLMFMFGFLKFFQPFRGWFDIQIQQSHLPQEAILAGKLGEMVTGCLFLLPWIQRPLFAK